MPKTDLALAGGEYAPVADRITLFYERFPEGRIITELVARSEREVTFRAAVYRSPADREPAATGWAAEREGDGDVNSVACLENTETSAIGRALANLGFTASTQRPSLEEMARASARRVAQGRRPVGVAEPAPRQPQPAQAYPADIDAPLRADVRALVDSAEREGLRPARVAVVRDLAGRPDATPGQLEEVERGLRAWLARRTAVGRRPASAPSASAPSAEGPSAG
ncbi:MAG: hypothetical protein ACYC2G_13220 [Gemmatimonadaceae bacterium]